MQTSNNCSMSMTVFPVLIALSTGLLLLITTISPSNQQEAIAQPERQSSSLLDTVTMQNTSMSVPAPNAPVNKQNIPHQIVVALPLREDGKIWTGTVTFTASKPIEIEV